MARNGAEPARELRRVLQLRQPAKREQERLLRHIFGPVLRTERLPRYQQHGGAKPVNQFIAGFPAAQSRHFDDFAIAQIVKSVLRRHAAGSSCLKETAGAAKDRLKPDKVRIIFVRRFLAKRERGDARKNSIRRNSAGSV